MKVRIVGSILALLAQNQMVGFGKDKVMIYITTGVDGVGELPSDNIQCNFTKTSLDLKVCEAYQAVNKFLMRLCRF